MAVNEATGEIYVADLDRRVVDVFGASGEYLSQLTGTPVSAPVSGDFHRPTGLAFDQATHELYVADEGVVDVFEASGGYVSQFGDGVLPPMVTSVAINELSGNVYVGGAKVVDVFDSLGDPVPPEWRGAGTPVGSFAGIQFVGLDHATGHVFAVEDEGNKVVDEFGASASEGYVDRFGAFDEPRAVAVDPSSGDVYVAEANNGNGVVDVFGPEIVVPDVTMETPSNVAARSVTLNGVVNPDGEGSATCRACSAGCGGVGEWWGTGCECACAGSPGGHGLSLSGGGEQRGWDGGRARSYVHDGAGGWWVCVVGWSCVGIGFAVGQAWVGDLSDHAGTGWCDRGCCGWWRGDLCGEWAGDGCAGWQSCAGIGSGALKAGSWGLGDAGHFDAS